MNNKISPKGYSIIDGIVKDFTPDQLAEIQQRATDIITGIMLAMRKEA